MPIPVTVYTWVPGGAVAINRHDELTMYDLPAVGSRYFRDREPFTVRKVDEGTDPPTVHLEHDAEWERELREALPVGYWVDGGRDDGNGMWHFHLVQDGVEKPIGDAHSDSLEEALAQAISVANRRGE